jgi:lincosamide nucleotidyltransferase A/C/D/E
VQAEQVVSLMSVLRDAGIRVWVAGGWAVDILVGHQTRPHGDLDLAVDAGQLPDLMRLLEADGFRLSSDELPSRAELSATDGRVVDLHPVRFSENGSGLQSGAGGPSFRYAPDGFTAGSLDGVLIPCLSAAQQLEFRRGYAHRPVDHHDLALLNHLAAPSS